MPNVIVSTEMDGAAIDVGDLFFTPGRHGSHVARFTYDKDFIRRGWPLEPGLYLDGAAHDLPGLPLSVEDCAPDTWGEMLLQREERHRAHAEGRSSQTLTPDLVLLAANDSTRQGALRFRTEQDGPFLGEHTQVPRTLDIAELLTAADEAVDSAAADSWQPVERLLAAGTSALGGARPKAAVRDKDGGLWLAKFPRIGEGNNVPLWEMVALDIAERAGLRVPDRKLITVAGRQVLLVRRFDRSNDGSRTHYMSARTLLGARDLGTIADYGQRGGIASRLGRESVNPRQDLRLLWKQAALNILINNTDNHLRNHGLLREGGGWRLSPVFDLDPNPDTGTQFQTSFGGAMYRGSALRGLLSIAKDADLDDVAARDALGEVHHAVFGWDGLARGYGATMGEMASFSAAFTGLDDAVKALLSPRGPVGTARK